MPLPESNTPWPPKQPAAAGMALHAAWYAGDRETLAKAYGRLPADVRPSARRLMFWQRQPAPGQRDTRLHIPLPADMATTSADLLFSEPPTFEVDGAPPATQDRLDEIVEQAGVVNRLLEGAEVSAALGGVYLKVDWDKSLAEHPLLAVVHADAAVPEFRWGQLVAVTFWRTLNDDGVRVLRYLERHEVAAGRGVILHGLYEGTRDNLGHAIPLIEHPATAGLVDGLEDGNAKPTGLDRLTAGYVPNMRPNRRHRGSDLGRSDYQNVEDLFDALDETWTSWMRDLRLGRGRMVVPQEYLRNEGRGQGASFDAEQEVFTTLAGVPPTASTGITLSQFAIRVDEHSRTAQELIGRAIATAGYSGQTFGLAGDVAATATEVTARERKSFITRDKKARYWAPTLSGMLEVMLLLDRELGFSKVEPVRPRVVFGDSVSEDPKDVASTLQLLTQAQALSTQTKVERLHPEWDASAVADEVARIHAEQGMAVPDPVGGGGLPGDPPAA